MQIRAIILEGDWVDHLEWCLVQDKFPYLTNKSIGWTLISCGNHLTIYVNQITTLYTLTYTVLYVNYISIKLGKIDNPSYILLGQLLLF